MNNSTPTAQSGFHTWADTLPTIDTLIKQIKKAKGYMAKRRLVAEDYARDCEVFGQYFATLRAQVRLDNCNGVTPDAAIFAKWFQRIPTVQERNSIKTVQFWGVKISGFFTHWDAENGVFPTFDAIIEQMPPEECAGSLKDELATLCDRCTKSTQKSFHFDPKTAHEHALFALQVKIDEMRGIDGDTSEKQMCRLLDWLFKRFAKRRYGEAPITRNIRCLFERKGAQV